MIKPVESGLKCLANSSVMKNHINRCLDKPQFLTNTLLVTSVSKDVLAYSLRVHNTLNNDQIPEKKKHFSATMDAVTGITTGIVQILSGLALSNDKVQNSVCKKLFSHLDENSKQFKNASAGFRVVSTLIGATLIAKRVLVPLISSPIATYLEEKHKINSNLK